MCHDKAETLNHWLYNGILLQIFFQKINTLNGKIYILANFQAVRLPFLPQCSAHVWKGTSQLQTKRLAVTIS